MVKRKGFRLKLDFEQAPIFSGKNLTFEDIENTMKKIKQKFR